MPYEFDSYERYEYHRNENYNSNGFNMFDVLTPDALLLYEAADILENANYTKIETTRGTELRVTPPWDKRLRLDIRIYRMNGRPDMACIYIFGGVRKNEHFKGNDNIMFSTSCMMSDRNTALLQSLVQTRRNIERKRLYAS